MIRKKKQYSRPRRLYESGRIAEENILVKKYALKSKREIWKTLAKINYFRNRAMALAKESAEEQEILIRKLQAIGLSVKSIADILGLKVEDVLKRRLPSVVHAQKLATTAKQARQMITHKLILVGGKVVSSPSYLVPVALEKEITVKLKNRKSKAKEETATGAEETE